jgi:hypothetical protein
MKKSSSIGTKIPLDPWTARSIRKSIRRILRGLAAKGMGGLKDVFVVCTRARARDVECEVVASSAIQQSILVSLRHLKASEYTPRPTT